MLFKRADYPDLPGVYLMKDAAGDVIYVGKASSLRSRISQYFPGPGSEKTRELVRHIGSIDIVVTKSAGEALILESNLIKSYQPKYNMLLKDAKHYSYIAITGERFPRLLSVRRNSAGSIRLKNASIYGPFTEGSKRAISARYLRKLFKIRICGARLPKRDCLQRHIGNCDAPCIGAVSESDYRRNVDAARQILQGRAPARDLIAHLQSRMKMASESLDYEKAASLRDQVDSLKIFFERQNVESRRRADEDFLWFQRIGGTLHVKILRSRNGVIGRVETHAMAIKEQEEPELSFCMRYYDEMPAKAYSNLPAKAMEELNAAIGRPAFIAPGREKARVLDIAAKSLAHGKVAPEIIRLKDALGLEALPIIIETFDISTLFGEESVGSMVRFQNGRPQKDSYRRFRIKSVEGQDDYAMMREVVGRRYARLLKEGGPLPDLVLIDGGAGQLQAAMNGMDEAGIRLPVAALAKKEEELYLPNRMHPLRLSRSDDALRLLQRCRDEAHRFAVSYQRLRRGKKMKG